jgi:hypothetical protein
LEEKESFLTKNAYIPEGDVFGLFLPLFLVPLLFAFPFVFFSVLFPFFLVPLLVPLLFAYGKLPEGVFSSPLGSFFLPLFFFRPRRGVCLPEGDGKKKEETEANETPLRGLFPGGKQKEGRNIFFPKGNKTLEETKKVIVFFFL